MLKVLGNHAKQWNKEEGGHKLAKKRNVIYGRPQTDVAAWNSLISMVLIFTTFLGIHC